MYTDTQTQYSYRARKHGVNARGEEIPRKMYSCAQCNKLLTSSIKLKTHIEVGRKHVIQFNQLISELSVNQLINQ